MPTQAKKRLEWATRPGAPGQTTLRSNPSCDNLLKNDAELPFASLRRTMEHHAKYF
jgi:hypothetical protein